MKGFLKKALRIRKVLIGRDFYCSNQISLEKETLGAENACWTIYNKDFTFGSVVYSFGVGTDISFDLELIKKFQLQVHAFDPTPKSIQWVQQQNTPKEFIMHPYGLAAKSGKLDLFLPEQDNYVSGSIMSDMITSHKKVSVDVLDLSSIMKMLGHGKIDLLKMDIEGAEYEVIQNIIENQLDIKQILIEFHHRFKNIGIEKTKTAIASLNKVGYKIFDVAPSGEEISFIKL
jgi:FkbM family methyltransferase